MDADGKEVLRELLAPLFATLAPGFEAGAEELRMEATHQQRSDFLVAGRYVSGGASFSLTIAARYHPVIASSRIRILCGMSIMPDIPRQEGRMSVRLGERTISVGVQVVADSGREIMLFRPEWDRSGQPDGAANGSQPIRSETNSTASAAGSRR